MKQGMVKGVGLAGLELRTITLNWDSETLLTQVGIFPLKDVCKLFDDIDRVAVKRSAKRLSAAGQDPWLVIGVKKTAVIGWVVTMEVFAKHYRENLRRPYSLMPKGVDARMLLSMTNGSYKVSDIIKVLPISRSRIRHLASKDEKSGVYFHKRANRYLVDLSLFMPWLKQHWLIASLDCIDDDELVAGTAELGIEREDLLNRRGLFPLNEIGKCLQITSTMVKAEVQAILKEKGNPYQVMGIHKFCGRWYIRMTVFAPYYRLFINPYQHVEPGWTKEKLLMQKGVYRMTAVATALDFNVSTLREFASEVDSKSKYGVWKVGTLFVIQMVGFSNWFRGISEKREIS